MVGNCPLELFLSECQTLGFRTHCLLSSGATVPNSYSKKDPSLVQWVSRQRSLFKDGGLPQCRVNLLEKIGFIWDATGFRGNKGGRAKAAVAASLTCTKTQQERLALNNQRLQAQQVKLDSNQQDLDDLQAKLEENGETLEFLVERLQNQLG